MRKFSPFRTWHGIRKISGSLTFVKMREDCARITKFCEKFVGAWAMRAHFNRTLSENLSARPATSLRKCAHLCPKTSFRKICDNLACDINHVCKNVRLFHPILLYDRFWENCEVCWRCSINVFPKFARRAPAVDVSKRASDQVARFHSWRFHWCFSVPEKTARVCPRCKSQICEISTGARALQKFDI